MEAAIIYSELVMQRNIDFDKFAPRLSFQFTSNMELFEEVAKYRAARQIWSAIAEKRFKAKNSNSGRLRVFAGGTGDMLTLEQPLNNIIRATVQCLVGVLGGAQAIHVPAYDEAYSIPSEEAATLALRTQQILAHETGITKTVDPLGGSYYVESLTRELKNRALALMDEIEKRGGLVASIKDGYIQRMVQKRAYEVEKAKQAGTRVLVGVNKFNTEEEKQGRIRIQGCDADVLSRQKKNLARVKKERSAGAVKTALNNLRTSLPDPTINLFPLIIEAVKSYATVGEIVNVLKAEYGEYSEQTDF
jgi:methylmalonyl-CoA mutase N-terminal domain/subunit